MAEQTRTFPLIPTWRAAAQILTAALEDGTATGKHAARTELMRMADLLDSYRETQTERQTSFDVIADALTQPAAAFGQSFASEAEATAYADQMDALGYNTEVLPAQETVTTKEALKFAAEHFRDDRLLKETDQ